MRLGIMQPYLFPYIGYFQLINAVDKFVIYDDVNFIKQGWINRNNILINGKPHLFTVPVKNISSSSTINEVEIDQKSFPQWRTKFYKTLDAAYKKAPFYDEIMALVETVLETSSKKISELAIKSIIIIAQYLNLSTDIVSTSSIYQNTHLKAQERVLDICRLEKISTYINAAGGSELYSKKVFAENEITLYFISPKNINYTQFSEKFVPHLSLIDVLMFNSKNCIKDFLKNYELI